MFFDFLFLEKVDRRLRVRFRVENGMKCSDALKMFTAAFGESTTSRNKVYEWYERFTDGRENVDDDENIEAKQTSKR